MVVGLSHLHDKTFTKASRLRKPQDFRSVRKDGITKAGYFSVISQRLTVNSLRIGITASKKFGKACIRNRFKRLVREAFRLSKEQLPKGLEIEVIPKKTAIFASMQEIQKELVTLCTQPEATPVDS